MNERKSPMAGDDFADGGLGGDTPRSRAAAPVYEVHFFVSRRGASAQIAKEVADALLAAGYTVLVQDYDIPHGANFVLAMHEALKRCRHFIALLTKDYDSTALTNPEWT